MNRGISSEEKDLKKFQLDPSLPFAAKINPMLEYQQGRTIQQIYSPALSGFPSDQLAGTTVVGIPYNQFTFTQQQILGWYAQQANAQAPNSVSYPPDLADVLKANAGPSEFWNYSYEQLGLVPDVAPAFKTLDTAEVGTGRAVRVIQP